MNNEQFVRAINKVVAASAIKSTLKVLQSPIGRFPKKEDVERAKWYNELVDSDKANIKHIIKEAVNDAIFGFFCVLDGDRVIEDTPEKGDLKLYFVKDNKSILLNDQDQELLHDIYNSVSSEDIE